MAITLAVLSSICFGIALVTGRMGLRTLDARSGAAISIPTATVLFLLAAPFALDTTGFGVRAGIVFAVVGLFFPAVVTLLTFRSNEQLGPTITSAVSGTAPLFALLAAGLFLGEDIPARAAVAAIGVVAGIALLSWNPHALQRRFAPAALTWSVAGAVVRGLAQVGAKAGLLLWPNPYAAGLIGYIVSSGTVMGMDRLRSGARQMPTRRSIAWFALTGALNGGAVLLMYAALSIAPVSLVAPVIAAYPVVTAAVSAATLHDERLDLRSCSGAMLTVAAIVYLVSGRAG